MKFIVDTMLGRLARWLRLFGEDAEFSQDDDERIIFRAANEGRIILTKDRELALKAGKMAYFVRAEKLWSQIREVIREFGIKPELRLTRCPACNGRIEEVEKSAVEGLVPRYTYLTHDRFWRCNRCGKIYWEGSHIGLAKDDIIERILGGDEGGDKENP